MIVRARNRDEEAFRALYERYRTQVFNLIYRMVGDREESADLTQETFLRVWRALPGLHAEAAFVTWLRRIAVNLCRDRSRQAKLRTESLDEDWSEGGKEAREPADPGGDVADRVLQHELERDIQQAVSTLSPDHRAVITLHHLEGLGVAEIAQVMGCSVGTVKSRLARARAELKRKLRRYLE